MLFRSLSRRLSSHAVHPRPRLSRVIVPTTVALTSGSILYIYAQTDTSDDEHRPAKAPIPNLVRSYLVYTMCSIPVLVDSAPSILNTLSSIPGIKQIAEAVVRRTFFRQFVGGETAQETILALRELRNEHRGAMLSHSVEVDLAEATGASSDTITTPSYKRNVQESIHAIDAAADFEDEMQHKSLLAGRDSHLRRTAVAIKLTAMVPSPDTLTRFSTYLTRHRPGPPGPYPGFTNTTDLDVLSAKGSSVTELTPSDLHALSELRDDLIRLCSRAQERGVRVMIDAEYTWFQPAIDGFAISLMRQFNRSKDGKVSQPLIYSTFQAYLRRTPPFLKKALADAKKEGYTLGIKLVRGAYHPFEVMHHRKLLEAGVGSDLSPHPPVWLEKAETDEAYNRCAELLIDTIATGLKQGKPLVGVLFGTHNWTSAKLILKNLVDRGLAAVSDKSASDGELKIKVREEIVGQVYIAQLYGMCESLTQYMVEHVESYTPMVIKCVPYGVLEEVIPYLGRRAIENKSVLGGPGGATDERRRVGRELRSRFFG